MSVNFTRTREQLADLVLGKLGVLGSGASGESADRQVIYDHMDMRLKELHRHGTFWRKTATTPTNITLSAATSSISATTDMLFPVAMSIRYQNIDYPVEIIDKTRYEAEPDKIATGMPEKAVVDGGTFLFVPIPDQAYVARLTYEKITDDTTASTAPDVEVSMLRWLKDILAYDVADHWGINEQKVMRFAQESMIAEKNIRKLNAERVGWGTVAVDYF